MLGEKSSAETVKKNGEMVRRSYGTVDTFVNGEGEKTKKEKWQKTKEQRKTRRAGKERNMRLGEERKR